MFQFAQNEATNTRRRIFFYAVDSTDGFTAVTASITSGVVLIVKNGVTPGTSPVSPTFTHISNGLWYYEMTAGNLDTQGVLTVTITGSNIRTVQLIGYVYAGDPMAAIPTFPTNFSSLAITGTGAVTAGTVSDKTGYSLASGAITSTTFGADAITASVIANGAIDAATFAAGAIDAAAIATGAIDADAIAADAITSAKIANSAISIRLATDGTASEARIETGTVAADVWNAALASYTTSTTFGGRIVRTRSTSPSNETFITASNHIAADVHELQPAVITASDFSAGAIDANALAADAATEIATATWARDITGSPSTAAGYWLYQAGLNSQSIISDTNSMVQTAYIESIGDALLGRNIAGGSNTGRLVKEALYALRNKTEIVGSTLNVYNNVDGAIAWTASVASSAGANPVTGIDPA